MRFLPALFVLIFAVACEPLAAQIKILRWHTTLESAQQAARTSGKPLFVVFRCVPCAGCREWDALVAHKDPQIAEMRENFVCARIPQMNDVDIHRFEHDFDTTWSGYFTDADLNIYSRYGGRDETDHEARMNRESLLTTMREVLDAHQKRGKTEDAELLHPAPATSSTPADIPLLERHHSGCIHCHEVQEYRLRQAYVDGTFTRQMLFGFPLPENLGLSVERKHGHRVEKTLDGSAAARAGVRAGDLISRVNGVPIRSELDIRWALHRADESKPVTVTIERNAGLRVETLRLEVSLSGEWKQTELGWRKSLRSVPLTLGFLAFPLEGEDLKTLGYAEPHLALRVVSLRGSGVSSALGLEKDDVIIECDGHTKARTLDEFKSDLLRRHEPDSEVKVKVRRGEKTVELRGMLPAWSLDLSALP